jgi:hypothetical protein
MSILNSSTHIQGVTMKTNALIVAMFALAGVITFPAEARNLNAPRINQAVVVPASITSEEATVLFWMREEEKLARDVYLVLYAQWKLPAFQRIANSEQRHFDGVGSRLVQFGLADPASPLPGVFNQEELQNLYQQMVFNGSQSYIQALTVGATIEDVDIADLISAIDGTTNLALKRTYENLLEGSKNHLRAFVGLLRNQGADYTPTQIDQVLFDSIMGD